MKIQTFSPNIHIWSDIHSPSSLYHNHIPVGFFFSVCGCSKPLAFLQFFCCVLMRFNELY